MSLKVVWTGSLVLSWRTANTITSSLCLSFLLGGQQWTKFWAVLSFPLRVNSYCADSTLHVSQSKLLPFLCASSFGVSYSSHLSSGQHNRKRKVIFDVWYLVAIFLLLECMWSAELIASFFDTNDAFPSANQFDRLVITALSPWPGFLLVLSHTDIPINSDWAQYFYYKSLNQDVFQSWPDPAFSLSC